MRLLKSLFKGSQNTATAKEHKDCESHQDLDDRASNSPIKKDRDELDMEYIVSIAASRATRELVDREERRQKRWTLAVAVLAAIGVAAFVAALDAAVERELNSDSAKQNIKSVLDATVEDLRREIDLQDRRQRLSYLAFSLDFKDRFTDQERDEALRLIKGMSGEDDVLLSSDFALALQKIVDSLVSADQLYHVMEIANSFRELILGNPAISSSLPMLLGRHLLYAIDNNLLDEFEDIEILFSDLQASGQSDDILWATKPWAIGLDILRIEDEQAKKESVRRHLSELRFLSPEEKSQALLTMFHLQKSEWYQLHQTKDTDVVTRVFSTLFTEYDEDIRTILLSEERDTIIQIILDGLIQAEELEMSIEFLQWANRE